MKNRFRKSLLFVLVAAMLAPMFVMQTSAAVTFERKLGVPIDYQYNYKTVRYGTNKSTSSSGCGAASASMVVEYYLNNGSSQNPDTLFKWACDNGWYTGSGLSYAAVKKLCSNYGVTLNWVGTQSEIINALKAGYPIIALMGPGTFTSGGHYIVLSGIKIDGGTTYIRVNDPNSSSRTNNYYSLSTIWSEKRTSSSTPFGVCTYTSAPKGKSSDYYVEPGKYSKVVSSDGSLNIRASASGSGTLLGAVPSGTYVLVESISGNWAKITYNGINGYVNIPYLKDGGQQATVSAPTLAAPATLAHNTAGTVSWSAVSNATSYEYSAVAYPGEISAGNGKTIASGSGTGTSFAIPAQASGKYIRVTVTAKSATSSAKSTADIMVGPWASYPTDVQYIPVNDINGSQWTTGGSTIWTSSQTTAFAAVYWDAFLCSPNSDGTYTVKNAYRSNTGSKSISASGTDIIFAIHCDEVNYNYAQAIVVGDKLSFCGIYIDKATIRGSGYVLVNGGIPLAPTDITSSDSAVKKCGGNMYEGFDKNTTVAAAKAKFSENGEYMQIRNNGGAVVADTAIVGTGFTVNIVVDNKVKVSYAIIVTGDINGDGNSSSADLLAQQAHISRSSALAGAFLEAADFDGSGGVTASDYLSLAKTITNG